MSEDKTGPVFAIPFDKAQDLANQIDALKTNDPDLLDLAGYLHTFDKGFALICVAKEDFIMWPGGPDIRDFQLGGRGAVVNVIIGDHVVSNEGSEDTEGDTR